MRDIYLKELELLHVELSEMGWLCEDAISKVIDGLLKGDRGMATEVIACDDKIDQKEKDIETHCLKLLLMQQPVAGDLREVSAALKMITDMERIGDQARDIAEIILVMDLVETEKLVHLEEMAKAVTSMVIESINAFVNNDLALAQYVIKSDDLVDSQFLNVRTELIKYISNGVESKDHIKNAEKAIDLFMISKYFERIGDHATNIAEWVCYSITGERMNSEMINR